jgi:methylated-DNA-[protein]-cysteine S-methyltransferase
MRAPASFDAVVAFPAMRVGVRTQGDAIGGIVYLPRNAGLVAPGNALAARAARQLERYIEDADFRFELPLAEAGTPFQRRVWEAIRSIRRGRTLTYGEMARALASAPRAVGQACGSNPFPLVIPCHRVVGTKGIGGFAHHGDGFHIEVKQWLLQHEHAPIRRERARP